MDKNLEQELSKWIEQEQKYAKLFSASVLKSRAFKKERLKQLIAIEARYSRRNLQDPALLTFLKVEKRQLEHEVSPRIFSYMLRRFMDAVRLVIYRRRHRNQTANDPNHFAGSIIPSKFNTSASTFRDLISSQRTTAINEITPDGTRPSIGFVPNQDNSYGTNLVSNETGKISVSSELTPKGKSIRLDSEELQKKDQAPRKRMKISR